MSPEGIKKIPENTKQIVDDLTLDDLDRTIKAKDLAQQAAEEAAQKLATRDRFSIPEGWEKNDEIPPIKLSFPLLDGQGKEFLITNNDIGSQDFILTERPEIVEYHCRITVSWSAELEEHSLVIKPIRGKVAMVKSTDVVQKIEQFDDFEFKPGSVLRFSAESEGSELNSDTIDFTFSLRKNTSTNNFELTLVAIKEEKSE